MKKFSSKIFLLLLLLLLAGWVYAADGDSDLPYAEFVQVDDETMKVFQKASCQKERTAICSFPSPYVLFGSFTSANKTEAIVLSGAPGDGPYIMQGELFGLTNNSWQQLGPFEGDSYSFLIGDKCQKIISSKGNELLLCEDDFGDSYDDFIDIEFFPNYILRLIDFSKTPVVTRLFSTYEMLGDSLFCQDLKPNETFRFLDDIQITFSDLNNDSRLDIILTLRETEISSLNCATTNTVMKLEGNLPVKHELHWLFDGETFTPSPETLVFLDNLPKQ
jgi:hypothetical protein